METSIDLKDSYLRQIYEHIQDGILVMDDQRFIHMMNPAARRLTGWKIGERVPHCSFCQSREVKEDEERCYLIGSQTVPYFLSNMPTYHGDKIHVEMSTALIYKDQETGQSQYLLVLRDQSLKQKEEEARISKFIIKKLIEAQENEHKRLAQELHDGVGQSLYTVSVALQAIEAHVHEQKLNNYLSEVRIELEKVMNDVKSYSYQLRPQSLDQLGLVPTVHSLITTLQMKLPFTAFTFETNLEYRLNASAEINLYRVIQEALHNSMKYSHASEIKIRLYREKEDIHLVIKDNGVGFYPHQQREGLGLKHMKERMDQLNGTFEIQSASGEGTLIFASVPFKEVEHLHD
ncbi:MAG TPA: ATPase [Paenibacillaceae bacterium]|nr:ATPase [Paenibacillaceae bacterium]